MINIAIVNMFTALLTGKLGFMSLTITPGLGRSYTIALAGHHPKHNDTVTVTFDTSDVKKATEHHTNPPKAKGKKGGDDADTQD
jgi:hypothetical protein